MATRPVVIVVGRYASSACALLRSMDYFDSSSPTWTATLYPFNSYSRWHADNLGRMAICLNAGDTFAIIYRLKNIFSDSPTTESFDFGAVYGWPYGGGGNISYQLAISLENHLEQGLCAASWLNGRTYFWASSDGGQTWEHSPIFPSYTGYWGNQRSGPHTVYPVPGHPGSWWVNVRCGWYGPFYLYKMNRATEEFNAAYAAGGDNGQLFAQPHDALPHTTLMIQNGDTKLYEGLDGTVLLDASHQTPYHGPPYGRHLGVVSNGVFKLWNQTSWIDGASGFLTSPYSLISSQYSAGNEWIAGNNASASPTPMVKCTLDGGATWADKTGNFWTVINSIAGAVWGGWTNNIVVTEIFVEYLPRTFVTGVRTHDIAAPGTYVTGVRTRDANTPGTYVTGVRTDDKP